MANHAAQCLFTSEFRFLIIRELGVNIFLTVSKYPLYSHLQNLLIHGTTINCHFRVRLFSNSL